ncbi:MAG TPA: MFS transporter [Aliidongia sp.]|uniref:MFS transporter n=1 Tax=Aliidongia sp. TaxID=1914230 RepID=UPI002DDD5BBC|nr:MFS transporter [Aliidongia sp.]HEV2677805.1 MFS transporter [Aliidongia sp.]
MTAAVAGSRHGLGLTIAATSLGFVLVQLDVSIVNVALPRIATSLGADVHGLQWVVDAYTIAFAALLLSAGALGDRFGGRRAYLAGFALFILASIGCGLAPSVPALIAARAVQGIGAALLVPCSLTLLTHACGDDEATRGRAISLWTAAASVALAAGPILGGALVDSAGWRSIFLVNVPVGLIGIWLTVRFVDESPRREGGLDLPGQALALLTLSSLTGAVIEAGRLGPAPLVLAGFAIALASGTGFVLVERRTRRPMLPLGFFKDRTFRAATLAGLLINLTLYGAIFVLGLYLQQIRGYSPLMSGLAFLPFAIALGVANIGAGWLGGRMGLRGPMTVGLILAAIGYGLLWSLDTRTAYLTMMPGLILMPAGIGLAVPLMTTALLGTVPRSHSGVASGILNTVRQTGGAVGVALYGALLGGWGLAGFRTAFEISAVLLAGAAVAALCGIHAPARKQHT